MKGPLARVAALVAWVAYSTLLRMATPVYLARLWWRGAQEPLYRRAWHERLGGWRGPLPKPGRVWIHAVSLGETRAAATLIDALRHARPGVRILLTHGTATGREAGAALLQDGDAQAWLPWDTPGAVRRFFARHRPAIGVLMETEVWPNLLVHAHKAGLPMVLANARLSARSAARGARMDVLMRPAAHAFTQVLAQTEADARRLRAAGARDVAVMGNLKYDITPAPQLLALGHAWRAALDVAPVVTDDAVGPAGSDRLVSQSRQGHELLASSPSRSPSPLPAQPLAAPPPAPWPPPPPPPPPPRAVVLAAVTRDGEEAMLLDAWRAQPRPRPLLVLVPRHPQRFDAVAGLVRDAGFTLSRRSTWPAGAAAPPPDAVSADVWLGDSLGEMPAYYALADAALLGGSFAPLGGQNLIEAAACGCPLLMGPHTFNFSEAAELSLAAGASERMADLPAAVTRSVALAADLQQRAAMAQHAVAFAAAHRGAAARMAQALSALLPG